MVKFLTKHLLMKCSISIDSFGRLKFLTGSSEMSNAQRDIQRKLWILNHGEKIRNIIQIVMKNYNLLY